jgi:hypothetical protein
MPIASKHDVVRFQVSVDDTHGVNVLKGDNNLSCIQLDIFFGKGHLLIEVLGEILSFAKLQPEVDVVGSLESEVEAYDEGVVDLLQDVDLSYHELCLLAQNNFLLLKNLQSIQLLVLGTLCQKNLTERALAKMLNQSEILVFEGTVASGLFYLSFFNHCASRFRFWKLHFFNGFRVRWDLRVTD